MENLGIICVPVKIRTEHFRNISQMRYVGFKRVIGKLVTRSYIS
jgi:hypothetical protein